MITGAQIRAARALLRWSAEKLAEKAKVGVMTIRRAEAEDGTPSMIANNAEAIRRALETGGVEFTNGDSPGVRVRRQTLADFEFAGWRSSSADYGIVRARDGAHRILAEIATEYLEDLARMTNPTAEQLKQELLKRQRHFIDEIERRYRDGQFIEQKRAGSVFRVIRVVS